MSVRTIGPLESEYGRRIAQDWAVSRAEPRMPFNERLLYGSQTLMRWLAPSRSTDKKHGLVRGVAGLIKFVLMLVLLLFLPLFWLPFLVVRIVTMARTIKDASTIEMKSGEEARWGFGAFVALPPGQTVGSDASAITRRDPGFDPVALQNWALVATGLIEGSITSGDATPVRPLMACGLLRTHQALLDLQAQAEVSCEGSWEATGAEVTHVVRTPHVELVQVRVRCVGWCWQRHTPTGLTVRGSQDATAWTEDLLFGRSGEAVTPPGGGLPARRCPSCGAPLNLDPGGVCHYCRGVVTAGRYDWVLVSWLREPW